MIRLHTTDTQTTYATCSQNVHKISLFNFVFRIFLKIYISSSPSTFDYLITSSNVLERNGGGLRLRVTRVALLYGQLINLSAACVYM